MADAQYEVLEVRFVFKPDWTEAYVLCGPTSDGMIGVQGWHKKLFPPRTSALDILKDEIGRQKYLVEWDTGVPV